MRVLTPCERARIETADARGRQEHHGDEAACFRRTLERGPQRTAHEQQPEQQADEEEHLPYAAHARELEPLVAEPEAEIEALLLQRSEPTACGRANHDGDQRPEQHVHAELLQLRLMSR